MLRRDKARDDVSAVVWLLLRISHEVTASNGSIPIAIQEERGVRLTLDGGFCGVFTSENTFGKILSEKALINEQAEESHPECSTHEQRLPEDL